MGYTPLFCAASLRVMVRTAKTPSPAILGDRKAFEGLGQFEPMHLEADPAPVPAFRLFPVNGACAQKCFARVSMSPESRARGVALCKRLQGCITLNKLLFGSNPPIAPVYPFAEVRYEIFEIAPCSLSLLGRSCRFIGEPRLCNMHKPGDGAHEKSSGGVARQRRGDPHWRLTRIRVLPDFLFHGRRRRHQPGHCLRGHGL